MRVIFQNPELNETRIVSGMKTEFKIFMLISVVLPKIAIALYLVSFANDVSDMNAVNDVNDVI